MLFKNFDHEKTAELIWYNWNNGTYLQNFPSDLKPKSRIDGYKVQSFYEKFSKDKLFGWKIAATSLEGQKHIGVSSPMAGRILNEKVLKQKDKIFINNSIMSVAELEFVFKLNSTIYPRKKKYTKDEVLTYVECLYSGIELPNSRFLNFDKLGDYCLIADNACSNYFILGEKLSNDWKKIDLSSQNVKFSTEDGIIHYGIGSNVLGDPLNALTWLVNELSIHNTQLYAGQFITTGTCTIPIPIKSGDRLIADYGNLGKLEFQV